MSDSRVRPLRRKTAVELMLLQQRHLVDQVQAADLHALRSAVWTPARPEQTKQVWYCWHSVLGYMARAPRGGPRWEAVVELMCVLQRRFGDQLRDADPRALSSAVWTLQELDIFPGEDVLRALEQEFAARLAREGAGIPRRPVTFIIFLQFDFACC